LHKTTKSEGEVRINDSSALSVLDAALNYIIYELKHNIQIRA